MPSLLTQTTIALEAVLLLAGGVLLWRQGLSPAARTAATEGARAMPPWNTTVVHFLFFLWMVVCGGLVLQGIVGVLLKYYPIAEPASTIVAGGAFQVGMLAGVVIFRMLTSDPQARSGPRLPARGILQAGLVTLLISLPVLSTINIVWQNLLHLCGVSLQEQELVDIFAKAKSPLFLIGMIVLATVVAPVTEELIFRAGIFRYARTRLPRWAALLLPAALFAALHGNLASFAPLVGLGVILSLAYERTNRIAVSMVAHSLFNLHTILLIKAGLGF